MSEEQEREEREGHVIRQQLIEWQKKIKESDKNFDLHDLSSDDPETKRNIVETLKILEPGFPEPLLDELMSLADNMMRQKQDRILDSLLNVIVNHGGKDNKTKDEWIIEILQEQLQAEAVAGISFYIMGFMCAVENTVVMPLQSNN